MMQPPGDGGASSSAAAAVAAVAAVEESPLRRRLSQISMGAPDERSGAAQKRARSSQTFLSPALQLSFATPPAPAASPAASIDPHDISTDSSALAIGPHDLSVDSVANISISSDGSLPEDWHSGATPRRKEGAAAGGGMFMPDPGAFDNRRLSERAAGSAERARAPPCPETPLRKTPEASSASVSLSLGLSTAAGGAPLLPEGSSENLDYLGVIGTGSFGEVQRARHRSTGELTAVKMTKRPFRTERDRDVALEEVRAITSIGAHVNCVETKACWQEQGRLFMQMELLEGGNLKEYALKVNELQPDELWCVVADIASGLEHIHSRGFVHLDLKPENIFMSEGGETLKIGDFGRALELAPPTPRGGTADITADGFEGDSMYLAPELLDGQVSESADVFSLGIMLFDLAAQVDLPANGPVWHALRQSERMVSIPALPEMEALVRRMMGPAAARPSVAELLLLPRILEVQSRRPSFNREGTPSLQLESSSSDELGAFTRYTMGRTDSYQQWQASQEGAEGAEGEQDEELITPTSRAPLGASASPLLSGD